MLPGWSSWSVQEGKELRGPGKPSELQQKKFFKCIMKYGMGQLSTGCLLCFSFRMWTWEEFSCMNSYQN